MSEHRSPAEHVDRVWELADHIKIAMLVTWDGEQQRSRPMSAIVDREQHRILFLTDVRGFKDDQIEQFPSVSVNFADNGAHDYVAIFGQATVSNDRALIGELFTPFAKAWWDSADDPNIRVLILTPEDAEYWDGPAGPIATVKMLAAAATGATPDMGENAKVRL